MFRLGEIVAVKCVQQPAHLSCYDHLQRIIPQEDQSSAAQNLTRTPTKPKVVQFRIHKNQLAGFKLRDFKKGSKYRRFFISGRRVITYRTFFIYNH